MPSGKCFASVARRAQDERSNLSGIWWSQAGSNRRPRECHSRALPTELWPLQVRRYRKPGNRILGRLPSRATDLGPATCRFKRNAYRLGSGRTRLASLRFHSGLRSPRRAARQCPTRPPRLPLPLLGRCRPRWQPESPAHRRRDRRSPRPPRLGRRRRSPRPPRG